MQDINSDYIRFIQPPCHSGKWYAKENRKIIAFYATKKYCCHNYNEHAFLLFQISSYSSLVDGLICEDKLPETQSEVVTALVRDIKWILADEITFAMIRYYFNEIQEECELLLAVL